MECFWLLKPTGGEMRWTNELLRYSEIVAKQRLQGGLASPALVWDSRHQTAERMHALC